jgi:galacturonosyltransferase
MLGCQDNSFYNFRKELVIALKDNGYNVILAAPYGKKIDYFVNHGIKFVEIQMERRGTNPISDLKIVSQYLRIMKSYKVDIVLTFSSKCAIYGGWTTKILNIPCIVNNSGLIILPSNKRFLQPLINLMYKISDNKVSCMMYQNSYERDVLNKILNNRVEYKLIPGSGVNLDEFKYVEYPEEKEGRIIFNYMARIMTGKGINEYLECAKIIKKKYPNTQFRIFNGYEDDKYKRIVEEYERRGIIKYYGFQLDMKPFIAEAHAVIHPSYSEGMANICLEHSAMGRVCIGSDIPGVKEEIEDGKTGFLFKVRDVSSMVDAVEKFIKLEHAQKVEMGKLARVKMEKQFDRNIVTDIYLNEVNSIKNE